MNEDVLIAILEEGGKNDPVTKLEGEFDHDTNKKAIIDEETGVKKPKRLAENTSSTQNKEKKLIWPTRASSKLWILVKNQLWTS